MEIPQNLRAHTPYFFRLLMPVDQLHAPNPKPIARFYLIICKQGHLSDGRIGDSSLELNQQSRTSPVMTCYDICTLHFSARHNNFIDYNINLPYFTTHV